MVMGNAQLLTSRADSLSDADRASALTDIAREAERLNQIIENLLIVARYERGQRPEVEPTELRRFVRNACARFGQTHGRRVEVRTSSDVWCLAEHSYLEQVVDNVLTNADKYSPAGAEVTVSVCLREDEAIVSVEDRGPGVNDEEREIIFSSFYRSEATARRARGVGIGLAVCQRLVEAQGGRIWCEPRDGGGSVFSFTLPLLTDVGEG
jgi:two-component system sensor histidine kinase KdpD